MNDRTTMRTTRHGPRGGAGAADTDGAVLAAAWWSSVIEPGDDLCHALRETLGEADARAWVLADAPGPLPGSLLDTADAHQRWERAHHRWRPRALVATPEADLDLLARLGGRLVIPASPEWPPELDDLGPARPVALWVRGRLPGAGSVAVVGARAATTYGLGCTREISAALAEGGRCVVSGGAYGIDIAAHEAAAATGRTVAVMAGGLERPYPSAHASFLSQLPSRGGGLVSEVPPAWRPARWRFLGRNRVIAALARACVVVEATRRSGALATARRAMELGREVGAVPGPVTRDSSDGCHDLIRAGATLVRDASDVEELLAPFTTAPAPDLFSTSPDVGIATLPPPLRRTWDALPVRAEASLTRIVAAAGLGERETLEALAGLELAGLVSSSPRGWRRARSAL